MPVTVHSATKHPLCYTSEADQYKAATVFLQARGRKSRRIVAVEVDRIAYLDFNGRPVTAFITENTTNQPPSWEVERVVNGWPVGHVPEWAGTI